MNGSNMGIQWRDSTRLADLDFADDLSLLAQSRDTLQEMTTNFESEAGKVGLRISDDKTKVMHICEEQSTNQITVGGRNVDDVARFTYLGSILTCDGDVEAEVNCRVGKAASVFHRMRPVWTLSVISNGTKIWLYNIIRGVCCNLRL